MSLRLVTIYLTLTNRSAISQNFIGMSPRTEQQLEEIRAEQVLLIKQTTLELFAENGYNTTSISQIAKKQVYRKA